MILNDIKKPEFYFKICLFIWIISLPFNSVFYQFGYISLNLFLIIHMIYYKKFDMVKNIILTTPTLFIALAGIWLCMVISNTLNPATLASKSWHHTLMFIFRLALLFLSLIYFYVLGFFKKTDIINAAFFLMLILLFTGIYELMLDSNSLKQGISGIYSNRNYFSVVMGIGFLMSLLFVQNKKISYLLCAIFLFFVLFTFSRSVWTGILCAVFLYFVLNLQKITIRNYCIIGTTIIILGLIFYAVSDLNFRFMQLINFDSSGRVDIWENGIKAIAKQPFFGYGVDSYMSVMPKNITKWHFKMHNIELEILLYTGFFGLFFYLLSIFQTFKISFLNRNFKVISVLFYFFILMQFDQSPYAQYDFLSYIMIFVFLGVIDTYKFKRS